MIPYIPGLVCAGGCGVSYLVWFERVGVAGTWWFPWGCWGVGADLYQQHLHHCGLQSPPLHITSLQIAPIFSFSVKNFFS